MAEIKEVYDAAVEKFIDRIADRPDIDPSLVRKQLALQLPSGRCAQGPCAHGAPKVRETPERQRASAPRGSTEGARPRPTPQPKRVPTVCQGITKKNKPCTKRAIFGETTCSTHASNPNERSNPSNASGAKQREATTRGGKKSEKPSERVAPMQSFRSEPEVFVESVESVENASDSNDVPEVA